MTHKLPIRSPFRSFSVALMFFTLITTSVFGNNIPNSNLIIQDACKAFAGTLEAVDSSISTQEPSATISAIPNGDINIPDGFTSVYVLTQGEGLVIIGAGAEPTFEVTESGVYTIHTLVFDPNTLDLGIVEPGVTTGFDVFGLITEGGGDICASLDVAGAVFKVLIEEPEECKAFAGTLEADASNVCSVGETTISATPNGDIFVPEGYQVVYVLTLGEGLVIIGAGGEPSFTVNEGGNYTIHTLVYNPDTLDLGIVEPGVTTGFDVFGLIIDGGGEICASLDVAGAPITVEDPFAGTLSPVEPQVTIENGSATISATPNGDINVPDGYASVYVLTQGDGLVIIGAGGEPSFEVTEAGLYTIHTLVFDPNTLDLGIVEPGVTTGFDVFGLITEGGGEICASLDVPGAQFKVSEEECTAFSGTLEADASNVCSVGETVISATPNNDSIVPEGYQVVYVLTQGEGLVIIGAGGEPSFTVNEGGNYTIHTLVYNPDTLDLGIVEPGVTTGFDVFGLIIDGGGEICASLDVAGAPITVEDPFAGTLTADEPEVTLVNGSATISATPNGDINVPEGYASVFVLTQGDGLVIIGAGGEPSFEVTEPGDYTIHTLVFDPNTLDLGIVEPGVTTGFDVFGLITEGGGEICASLDVAGAQFKVFDEECKAFAGTLEADASNVCSVGETTISATPNGDIFVPQGYQVVYVLTQGEGLVIIGAGGEPSFTVNEGGNYTIHTLVYNPETLDLGIVEPGVTTGFDVFGLIIDGGGEICASLDVAGAPITVEDPFAGTLTADEPEVTLVNGSATISATPNGDINVPEGYASVFVLTQGDGLVIIGAGGEPSFEVTEAGTYTIHTLVYNPDTLDLGIVEPGVTTGFDVFGLITEGGGEICASLDVAGAPVKVFDEACEAFSGTMHANNIFSCLSGGESTISADFGEDPVIPEGYQNIFVLTNAFGLVILDVSATPEFTVTSAGFYRIHSLVYNPDTLDLSIVEPGVTTGFDVFGLITEGGGDICASLQVDGPLFLVLPKFFCWFYHHDRAELSLQLESFVDQYSSYEAFEANQITSKLELMVYPNPTASKINVSTTLFDQEVLKYTVSDLSGRIIKTGALQDLNSAIDLGGISSGSYLVTFESNYRKVSKYINVSR